MNDTIIIDSFLIIGSDTLIIGGRTSALLVEKNTHWTIILFVVIAFATIAVIRFLIKGKKKK